MHNIHYDVYEEKVNKNKVQAYWNEYAERDGDGMYANIRWYENGISDSEDEAMERIKSLDNHDYCQIAVKFKRHHEPKTKTFEDIKKRLSDAYNDYYKKSNKIHYSPDTIHSEFISCPGCKSKIAVKHIRWNKCPICGEDLRPKSALKIIENAKNKWKDLQQRLENEKKKAKYDICWLVKIEYHS